MAKPHNGTLNAFLIRRRHGARGSEPHFGIGHHLGYRWLGERRWKPGKPPPRWGVLWLLACLAGLSHILLDFTNNYGVRPFEPFSYRWYSWDIIFIVEPVLWIILLGGLVLPSLFGLVTDEVRSRRTQGPRGRAGAIVALVLVVALWGFRDYEHRRAVAALESLTYRGEAPLRVSAYPYYINPFRWYGVVETGNAYESMIVDSLTPVVDADDRAVVRYRPEETAALLAAKQSYLGRVFLDWAQYPMTETGPVNGEFGTGVNRAATGGSLVRFYDVRFAYPGFGGRRTLGGWVQLDGNMHVVGQNFGERESAGD
ncbi:MAG: metal-dependent hydrolase [Terriglobales bacterium]